MRGSITLFAAMMVTTASTARATEVLDAIDRAPHLGRIEAYQRRHELTTAQRGVLMDLLEPPTDLAYFVESESGAPFPVRVSFADPSLQSKAEQVLQAVAISYQREVVDFGFWPPLVEPGSEPYRMYIMDAGGAAGYTSPYLDNTATPHADAFTYIVIDPSLEDLQLDATVAHEFNHACQVAMDVAEVRSFMENTASYIEIPVFPAGLPYAAAVFPYFQSQPWRPLEYRAAAQTDGYEYGGALWPLFLTHHYADGDPVWIRQVWEGSVQDGEANEPDYFDAIHELLADDGGLPAAASTFARYRFFVGAHADGQHLPGAEQWGGAEVWMSAQWSANQLPVLDQAPPDPSTRPQPNGCNYIMLTPDASTDLPIRFSFDGETNVPWNVELVEIANGAAADRQTIVLDAEADGVLRIDATELERVLMMVCQPADASYDPDDKAWAAGDYHYSIELDAPPPIIDSVTPDQIAPGSVDVPVTIAGSGFLAGTGLDVALSGDHVAVKVINVSTSELRIQVTVAPSAELGPHDLVVTNPGGAATTAQGAIDIVAMQDSPETATSGEGCGCRVAPSSPPSTSPLWLLGAFGAAWWHRRRRAALGVASALAVLGSSSAASAEEYLDSTSYPLRIVYPDTLDLATAQQALGYAEQAWEVQVGQMGFGPIYTVDENDNIVEGLQIVLDPNAPYNHAEPIGDNPNTSWTDCTVKAVVANTSPASYFELVVAHEMSHAFEMAADCGESPFAWENTTMAVTVLMFGQDPLFSEFLSMFQENPHDGLDCFFFYDEKKAYYHYGAALFQLFIEDHYGNYDGQLLSAIWNAAKQDGSVIAVGSSGAQLDVPNDPNIMDAIGEVAGVPFDEAFAEFGRWRYFVGNRDDGAHFTQGASWIGAEVEVDTELTLAALPLQNAAPGTPISEYGTAYIELDLEGVTAATGIDLSFAGDPAMRWSVDALLVRADHSAEVRPLALDDAGAGQLLIDDDLAAFSHVTLVVSNLSDGDHNPDSPSCSVGASFSYSLALSDLALAPTVTGVDPAELSPGETHQVFLTGSDFADGMQVAISGDGLQIGAPSFVDASTVGVEVTVAADATPGPRDLTVQNPNGASATLAGAFTVQSPNGDEVVSGCGCEVPGPADARMTPWLTGLLLALFARRRRAR